MSSESITPSSDGGISSLRAGPYHLVRALGEGAFARTYEGRHETLGTRACVKIARDVAHTDLMMREARLLWDLHHPSLPVLRDAFALRDGRMALVMRFVEGTPLESLAPLDVPTAARVLGRLLRALRFVHHRGIVHNDVKPSNIIVEPDRQGAVLVDFGVGSFQPGRASRAPGATLAFAAPEVLAGLPPLPESDLYSLGLTMLHALGGDIVARRLPAGVPEGLLALLVSMSRPTPSRRARWGVDDPGRRLEALLPALCR